MGLKTIVLTRFLIDGLMRNPPYTDETAARAVRVLKAALQPSLAAQESRAFEWWLVGGERLRDVDVPGERLIIPAGGDMGATLRERLRTESGPVLTIRLDSDDAVERGFIGRLVDAAWDCMDLGTGDPWQGPPLALYQPRGFVCDVRAKTIVRRRYDAPSSFSAALERNDYRTVFAEQHRRLGKTFGVVPIPGCQTMQFLHGGNAVTGKSRFVVKRESYRDFDFGRFGVDVKSLEEIVNDVPR